MFMYSGRYLFPSRNLLTSLAALIISWMVKLTLPEETSSLGSPAAPSTLLEPLGEPVLFEFRSELLFVVEFSLEKLSEL